MVKPSLSIQIHETYEGVGATVVGACCDIHQDWGASVSPRNAHTRRIVDPVLDAVDRWVETRGVHLCDELRQMSELQFRISMGLARHQYASLYTWDEYQETCQSVFVREGYACQKSFELRATSPWLSFSYRTRIPYGVCRRKLEDVLRFRRLDESVERREALSVLRRDGDRKGLPEIPWHLSTDEIVWSPREQVMEFSRLTLQGWRGVLLNRTVDEHRLRVSFVDYMERRL